MPTDGKVCKHGVEYDEECRDCENMEPPQRPTPLVPGITAERYSREAEAYMNHLEAMVRIANKFAARMATEHAFKMDRTIEGFEVQHIDGDPNNNEMSNVKLVPRKSL